MKHMHPLIVSLGLFKDSGGPVKTIGKFKQALAAEAYSIADPKRLDRDPVAVEGTIGIPSSRIPILRQLNYLSNKGKTDLIEAAKSASIISCHSFYRYHVRIVEQLFHDEGIPYWFVPHGILDPWVFQKQRILKSAFWKLIGNSFLDNCKTVVFSTRAERDKAASQFSLPSSSIIPWPVDVVKLENAEQKREMTRAQYGIPQNARLLLYFGRLHSMKCPLETIQAVGSMSNPDLYLIMLGNENDVTKEQCLSAAKKSGLGERLVFTGPVYGDAKYDIINCSDAYISLSFRENFNHTAAECLAARKPVILSPGNDLLSEFENVDCHIPMRSTEQVDVRDSITEFLERSDKELTELGSRGQKWVFEKLSFEQFQESLRDLVAEHGIS